MAIMIEGDRNEINYYRDQADARRWRKLVELVGHPGDASDVTVKLYWDDATMTPFIEVGKTRRYFVQRGSLSAVIDSIPAVEP